MSIAVVDGWLEVPYTGPERATIEISTEAEVWVPAYLDYTNGTRVAKIRPPAVSQTVQVWLRVDGAATPAGWLNPTGRAW